MDAAIKQELLERKDYLTAHKDRLVIDGDTHLTDLSLLTGDIQERYESSTNYYHGKLISAEDGLTEMDMAGVDCALCWQNPAAIAYGDDGEANFQMLLAANRYIHEVAAQYKPRLLPAGWTDPKALGLEGALKLNRICVNELGFPIVKLNPAQNAYPIDSELVFKTVENIVELGATPAFHYGGDSEYTPAEGLEKVAQAFPQSRIIAVHMGGGGSHYVGGEETYLKTRELGLRQSNLFFILSAKRDTHIESDLITYQLAGAPYSQNIACGSDAPYGRMTWNFGGYRCMFDSLLNGAKHTDKRLQATPDAFDAASVQGYLGRNFAEFYIKAIENVLAKA